MVATETNKPPKISKFARSVIEKAIKSILRSPEHFDMRDWLAPEPGREQEACGTVGCLAGHIALAAGLPAVNIQSPVFGDPKIKLMWESKTEYEKRELPYEVRRMFKNLADDDSVHVSSIASKLLKLNDLHDDPNADDDRRLDSNVLFDVTGWPEKFSAGFYRLSRKDQARRAVARLRYYLKTGV
ncbi:MAG TPA: hypothetical protein VEF04_19235 [Blastocatellia bacterium]|nr:hypothetical protein [Blastocatellia bacterium]